MSELIWKRGKDYLIANPSRKSEQYKEWLKEKLAECLPLFINLKTGESPSLLKNLETCLLNSWTLAHSKGEDDGGMIDKFMVYDWTDCKDAGTATFRGMTKSRSVGRWDRGDPDDYNDRRSDASGTKKGRSFADNAPTAKDFRVAGGDIQERSWKTVSFNETGRIYIPMECLIDPKRQCVNLY